MKPDDSASPVHYAMKVQDRGEEFVKELKIMGQMNCENIVQLKIGRYDCVRQMTDHFFVLIKWLTI